jgi:hypothetical protein
MAACGYGLPNWNGYGWIQHHMPPVTHGQLKTMTGFILIFCLILDPEFFISIMSPGILLIKTKLFL